ncbi:cupin-like domain-containing protein [Vitiosangium sp. GDMCC 1.1324]|uniref:cupin-like domain-containing protein n=1 Tax=Vitiosangium sp. (strain GDMCC 1.1324) TaxID=2138576 RepID=UPI000D391071|nr:cupin-like domain-containing protein [Vitiosangium sp. GDMCC 1.1324]PTL82678.1 hypothetical protein DAT35_18010 [Vitiosangium sp. GDMCC 1.1324]
MPLPPLPFDAKTPRKLHRPPLDELREWHYREPVFLKGMLDSCPLLKEFQSRSTLDARISVLGEYFQDRTVDFCVLPPESGGHYLPELVSTLGHGDDVAVQGVPFSEFARRLKAAPTTGEYVYMQDGVLEQELVRGALQFDFLKFSNPIGARSKFWVGSDGQVFNLHYDDFINFICMFEGTKRVTMFPPEQMPNMYHAPYDILCGYAPTTHVQLLKANFDHYPKFRTALQEAYVAVLEPGDVLLIPPFWWHHVESFSPMHVMVNNFISTVPFAVSLELWKCLSEAIRALAPATPAERARVRESFQRAVLADIDTPVDEPLSERARQTAQKLPPSWRRHMARLYDEAAFQVHGAPFTLAPGGLQGLIERQAAHVTLFPFANLLADAPEMLELPHGDPHPR